MIEVISDMYKYNTTQITGKVQITNKIIFTVHI